MVYLSKKEVNFIIKSLSESSDKKVKEIIKKLKTPKEKRVYVYGESEIQKLLRKAFKDKRKVKIRYYSPHSDEAITRIINIYKIQNDCVISYCNLREDERVFRIDRINSATILDKKYSIPKGWKQENIILVK